MDDPQTSAAREHDSRLELARQAIAEALASDLPGDVRHALIRGFAERNQPPASRKLQALVIQSSGFGLVLPTLLDELNRQTATKRNQDAETRDLGLDKKPS